MKMESFWPIVIAIAITIEAYHNIGMSDIYIPFMHS